MTYSVIDNHTGRVVARGLSLKEARISADRMDLAYGACRYRAVVEICSNWGLPAGDCDCVEVSA